MKRNSFTTLLTLLFALLALAACTPTSGEGDTTSDPYADWTYVFAGTLPETEGIDYADGLTLSALIDPGGDADLERFASTPVNADGSFRLELPAPVPDEQLAVGSDVFDCTSDRLETLPIGLIWTFDLLDEDGEAIAYVSSYDSETDKQFVFTYVTESLADTTACTDPAKGEAYEATFSFDTSIGWTPLGVNFSETGNHYEYLDDPTHFSPLDVLFFTSDEE